MNKAICCYGGSNFRAYNITDVHSVTEEVFNKTRGIDRVVSCLQTRDKNHIIDGGYQKFFILDAEGNNTITHTYAHIGGHVIWQFAEVLPGIIITAEGYTYSVHDIRDLENIPKSYQGLPDIGNYFTVIALNSNPGDFALGGWAESSDLGFVQIGHMEVENASISNHFRYFGDLPGPGCEIYSIKEIQRGTILFAGSANCQQIDLSMELCRIPSQQPQCWEDQINGDFRDIVQVPY